MNLVICTSVGLLVLVTAAVVWARLYVPSH